MANLKKEIVKHPHHQQSELCLTRAKYRQGRKLTAVKVYTVNNESLHLLIVGVPALGLHDDLRRVCTRYGDVKSLAFVPGYSDEEFTDSYHVQYSRIQSARHAKRRLDGMSFYGGVLHVCYAPEIETVAETREKLIQRRKDVACRINGRTPPPNFNGIPTFKDRRKHGRGMPNFDVKKARLDEPSTSTGCIWKGQLLANDPRTTTSEKAPVYGPSLPEGFKAGALPSTNAEDTSKSANDFSWTSKSKFIPRQITLKKAIIFRKRSDDESKTDEDNSLISTQKHINDVLDKVAEPSVSINFSKVQSALNME